MISTILRASLATLVSASKPTFELFFGDECPFCMDFPTTVKQLYHADGIAAAVDFKLSPYIDGPGPNYSCVDEVTCDPELYYLCAQAVKGSTAVDFLACEDAALGPFPKSGRAADVAQKCATSTSLDWRKISTCFAGDQGKSLLQTASQYFDKRFPSPVVIPRIEINGDQYAFPTLNRTYAVLLKALCATGIQAGACPNSTIVV